MVIVYNQKKGNLLYTIEGQYSYDKKFLQEGEAYKITNDESIKSYTHKINLKTNEIIKRTKEERELELQERQVQAEAAEKKRKELKLKYGNKILELEDRIKELEKETNNK